MRVVDILSKLPDTVDVLSKLPDVLSGLFKQAKPPLAIAPAGAC